jgi:acetate kinase
MIGYSVDTTMGFTPLAGVPMGTRSGDIDPAIVTFLMNKKGMTAQEADALLNKKSGVFGVSGGLSSDFRDLENAAKDGDDKAQLARDVFTYNVAKYVGAYAAAMNGVDAIAFTAGVGENDNLVRKDVIARLGFLGIELDEEANSKRGFDNIISTADSKVTVCVIPTNEELAIARETLALVK